MYEETLDAEARRAVLCYVEDGIAYFTTQVLEKQWGDDWNDAPYEHNAGAPYEPYRNDEEPWRIIAIGYRAEIDTPAEWDYGGNSRWSVEMINKRVVAWLTNAFRFPSEGTPEVVMCAGTTVDEFCVLIRAIGGEVFQPVQAAP